MAFGFFKKIGRGLGKVGKGIVKNPLTKAVAGGVAIVFPPVGVPIAAGVAVTDRVLKDANQKRNPALAAKAKTAIRNTMALSTRGHVGASNAMTLLNKRAAALREAKKYKVDRRGCTRRVAG